MKFFGNVIGKIGAFMWEKGCKPKWTGNEKYEELSFISKIGYALFLKGCEMMLGKERSENSLMKIFEAYKCNS